MVTIPPGVGGLRTGRYSDPLAGAAAMFLPLEPSRFSAPQLIAEPGSPAAAVAVPYEYVSCPPAGRVRAPEERRIQPSPVWVVALLNFLTPSKSTISQLFPPPLSTLTRIRPPAGAVV